SYALGRIVRLAVRSVDPDHRGLDEDRVIERDIKAPQEPLSRVVRADVDDRDLVRRVDVVRPVPGNDLLALPRHGEASREAAEGGSQIGRRADPADVHVADRASTRGPRADAAPRRDAAA